VTIAASGAARFPAHSLHRDFSIFIEASLFLAGIIVPAWPRLSGHFTGFRTLPD
jgi:hypothetical protein